MYVFFANNCAITVDGNKKNMNIIHIVLGFFFFFRDLNLNPSDYY